MVSVCACVLRVARRGSPCAWWHSAGSNGVAGTVQWKPALFRLGVSFVFSAKNLSVQALLYLSISTLQPATGGLEGILAVNMILMPIEVVAEVDISDVTCWGVALLLVDKKSRDTCDPVLSGRTDSRDRRLQAWVPWWDASVGWSRGGGG